MTKVRFQADADLRQAIVTGVIRRQPKLDPPDVSPTSWDLLNRV
jgi:hypothetical protein